MGIAFRASRDVIIRTDKFQEAKRFYASVLNLQIVHDSESLVGFDAGAFRLYLENGRNQSHAAVFDFIVSDIGVAKSALVSAGCTILEETPSVPRCYICDPYGLVFNIEQE